MSQFSNDIFYEDIDYQIEHERKKQKMHYSLSISIIFLALVLFYFDLGPPLPPYFSWFDTDDCYSIEFFSFHDNGGILNFTFFSAETYELPREYLPNLIKIKAISDLVNITYYGSHITNRTVSGQFFYIIVPHQFISDFTFEITCLDKHHITNIHHTITDLSNKLPQYSTSRQIGPKEEIYNNVCIEQDESLWDSFKSANKPLFKLNFFSMVDEIHVPFEFSSHESDFQLKFQASPSKYTDFSGSRDDHHNHGNYLLSPALDENLWQLILFDLPEIENIKAWSNFDRFEFIVPRETSTTTLVQSRFCILHPPQCFKSLAIANFKPNISFIQDEQYIWSALNQNYTNFRQNYVVNFVHNKSKNKNIIIADDPSLTELSEFISNFCHSNKIKCFVNTVDQNIFKNSLTDKTNKAHLLIGNHISNLAMIALMNNGTSVVDFTPLDYSCNNWTKQFAQKFGVKYHYFYEDERNSDFQCKCSGFSRCYPLNPSKIEVKSIESKIRKLLLNLLK